MRRKVFEDHDYKCEHNNLCRRAEMQKIDFEVEYCISTAELKLTLRRIASERRLSIRFLICMVDIEVLIGGGCPSPPLAPEPLGSGRALRYKSRPARMRDPRDIAVVGFSLTSLTLFLKPSIYKIYNPSQ